MPEIETLEDEVGFFKYLLSFALTFAHVNYVLRLHTVVNVCKQSFLISVVFDNGIY